MIRTREKKERRRDSDKLCVYMSEIELVGKMNKKNQKQKRKFNLN